MQAVGRMKTAAGVLQQGLNTRAADSEVTPESAASSGRISGSYTWFIKYLKKTSFVSQNTFQLSRGGGGEGVGSW